MHNAPLVSVVIPAYNQGGHLRSAMISALQQSMSDLELIVVDDGSIDNTFEVCHSLNDSRVRYVYQVNDGTRGIGARNTAMLQARGTWVALLDQDDLWYPRKLELQMKELAAQPIAGAVYSRVKFVDIDGEPTGFQNGPLPSGDVFHLLLAGNRYYASSGVFRRDLIGKMGLPHESVGLGDWALWLSVARHAEVAVVDEVLVDYRVHAEGFQMTQLAADSYSFWRDHFAFMRFAELRMHEQCAECVEGIGSLQRSIAQSVSDAAGRSIRHGNLNRETLRHLKLAWQAQPHCWFVPASLARQTARVFRVGARRKGDLRAD